ncbi:MAG: glycosyltransferase [Bryobacteraceae bacterium]
MDFTVIVPTFNRPSELAGCLESLLALRDPGGGFEVIVVDDAGDATLEPVVQQAAARASAPVRLLRLPRNQGPGPARNAGAELAEGRWLALTDDDCRPRPDWLAELRPALAAPDAPLAGGRTVNQLKANPYAEATQLIVDAAYAFFNPDPENGRFLASNNLAVERERFRALGGFDPAFRIASEDRDLCDRWRWRGGRIAYAPNAIVEHRHDLDLSGFLRQHYAYGRGAAQYHCTRRVRGSGRMWDDLSFRWRWRDLIVRPALATPWPARMLALMACWQLANTAGFARGALTLPGRAAF